LCFVVDGVLCYSCQYHFDLRLGYRRQRHVCISDRLLVGRRAQGPLLVACALGYSRSATLVAAWLLLSGRAADVESAVAVLRRARPQVLLGEAQRRTLAALSGSVPEPSAELGEVRHA
ncbi:dual specificity protein phosphatase family protein, partial [Pseudomonas aeruginosa]